MLVHSVRVDRTWKIGTKPPRYDFSLRLAGGTVPAAGEPRFGSALPVINISEQDYERIRSNVSYGFGGHEVKLSEYPRESELFGFTVEAEITK